MGISEQFIRITAIQTSFKKAFRRFSGVPVNANTHIKTNHVDYYFVTALEKNLAIEPEIGQVWQISGDSYKEEKESHNNKYKINHITYRRTNKCTLVLPKSNEAFIDFISKNKAFKGISGKKAGLIWTNFGSEIFEILTSNDQSILEAILTQKSIDSLVNGYKKYGNLKYSVWFTEKEIPLSIQKRIFRFHASDYDQRKTASGKVFTINPIDIISSNPYFLVNMGMSFKDVDDIAQKHFCLQEDDANRLVAAVTEGIRKYTKRNGHTIAEHRDVFPNVVSLLDNEQLTSNAMLSAYNKQAYVVHQQTGYYQLTPVFLMENTVAKRLLKLKNIKGKFDEAENLACINAFSKIPFPLEQLQTEAVVTSIENAVSAITGGAGTGKTTVLCTILNAYTELGYEIKAMALSGRAALRLKESIQMETMTIAKFLLEDAIERESKILIVIDEASMLDLVTFYRIVIHTHPSVRFIFCGDPGQLTAIGAGKILADIVDSGVIKNTKLNIVKRQSDSTGIPSYSKLINDGVVPAHLSIGNIHFHDIEYDSVARHTVDLFKSDHGECKIIAPTNKLVSSINELCQQEINPTGKRLHYVDSKGEHYWEKMYEGDPVLFTENNYDADVQNGTLGILTSVEQAGRHHGKVLVDGSNEELMLTKELLLSMQAGYAITLHKAQGSQFKRVIVPLSPGSNLDRSWIYTAITRAENEVHIIGPMSKYLHAIRSISNTHIRKTNLVNLLNLKSKSNR